MKDIMVFSFHCSLHYDTECGLGEDEYLKTFSEARNQDILGKRSNETIPKNLNQTPFAAQPLLGCNHRHTLLTVFTLKTSIHKSIQKQYNRKTHQNLLRYENSKINGL